MFEQESENREAFGRVASAEYEYSKYVRMDNRAQYAGYLGYLDVRELYPDSVPRKFTEFVRDLMDGKVRRPYSGAQRSGKYLKLVVVTDFIRKSAGALKKKVLA